MFMVNDVPKSNPYWRPQADDSPSWYDLTTTKAFPAHVDLYTNEAGLGSGRGLLRY